MIIVRTSIIFICLFFALFAIRGAGLFAQEVSNKAIVGKVSSITGRIVAIQEEGKTKEITTDASTKIYRSDKQIALSQVKGGDSIAVIATSSGQVGLPIATQSGILATPSAQRDRASKIYVKEASSSAQVLTVVVGTITGINEGMVTVMEKAEQENFYTVVATSSATISTLKPGQHVAVVGKKGEDGDLQPVLIHALSQNP